MISSPRLPVWLERARAKLQSFCAAAAASPHARASDRQRRPTAGGIGGTTLGLEGGRWRSPSSNARSALVTTRTSPTGITRGGGGSAATTIAVHGSLQAIVWLLLRRRPASLTAYGSSVPIDKVLHPHGGVLVACKMNGELTPRPGHSEVKPRSRSERDVLSADVCCVQNKLCFGIPHPI